MPANIYDGIFLIHKKEWNNAICSNMDGPRDYHTKWSKKKTNITWYHLYMESKKWYKWTHLQNRNRASLVAQWLRICLPTQGTRVRSLVWEAPTCRRATKPVRHNYWACALEPASHNYWRPRATTTEACTPRACAPQQEKPPQWEACTPPRRVAPAHCN